MRIGPRDGSTEQRRGQDRYRRAGLMAMTSAVARGATIAVGLISVPLAMSHLGAERYGVWLTMSSFMTLLLFADLGVGDGVIKPLSAAVGRGDLDGAQRIVSSAFVVLLSISALVVLVFAAAYPLVDWPAVFNVQSPVAIREAGPAAAVMVLSLAATLVAGLATRINLSLQEGMVNDLWQTGGSLLSIAVLLAATRTDAGLPVLVLALSGVPVIALVANGASLFALRRPELRPHVGRVDGATARSLFGTARWFLLSYVGMACVLGAGTVAIAQLSGPERVAEFGLPLRIFTVVSMAVGLLVFPLWPAYAEALERQDLRWVVVTVRRSVGAAAAIGLIGSAAVVLTGDTILRLWVGGLVTTSPQVWLGLGVWSVLACVDFAISVFLWGAGAVKVEALMRLWQTLVVAVLLIALVPRLGVIGSAWALAIGELMRFVPSAVVAARVVRRLTAVPADVVLIAPAFEIDSSLASRG